MIISRYSIIKRDSSDNLAMAPPPFDFRLLLRGNLTPEYERDLFDRYIQIGADGSIILDGDDVYILWIDQLERRLDQVDYFHGIHPIFGWSPVATMHSDMGWPATWMLAINRPGFVIKRILAFQRMWRSRRMQLANAQDDELLMH